MCANNNNVSSEKIGFEAAIDKTGFGLYSYCMICVVGVCIISFACIGYSSMFLVPTSACELETTVSQQGLLAAGPIVGLILGGLGWGYVADTRGRRAMLLVALFCSSLVNLIATLSVNWVMLLILQFLASLLASGIYSMSISLLSESVPMGKRNFVVILVSSIFLLSQGIMALLAIPIIRLTFSHYLSALGIYWNSWRLLMLVYSIPSLISIVLIYFVNESPKFVFVKGDEARALEILRKIHKYNNNSKEEYQVKGLMIDNALENAASLSAKDQIVPLFKSPLLKYTLIMTTLFVAQQINAIVIWLPKIADELIRIVQTGEGADLTVCGILDLDPAPADPDETPCALDETSLLIVFGLGALQSILNTCISLVITSVGRRNMVIIMALTCGGSGIIVNLVPNVIASTVFFVILMQATLTIGLNTAIIVALFPTHLRAMAIALAMTGGRAGTFASVQIVNALLVNNCDVAFYLFSAIYAASVIVAALLPDDRKLQAPPKPIPRMEESPQEDVYQHKNTTE